MSDNHNSHSQLLSFGWDSSTDRNWLRGTYLYRHGFIGHQLGNAVIILPGHKERPRGQAANLPSWWSDLNIKPTMVLANLQETRNGNFKRASLDRPPVARQAGHRTAQSCSASCPFLLPTSSLRRG